MSYTAFIETIAKEAGLATKKLFGCAQIVRTKEHSKDFVTEADVAANLLLVERIRSAYPSHGIISEEMASENAHAEYVWIIDPIDGTHNYATGIPAFGTMVALAHQNEIILSAIYLPLTDELYAAEKGNGATLNGVPIHCSDQQSMNLSRGCLSTRHSTSRSNIIERISSLSKTTSDETPFWVANYYSMAVNATLVAAGRQDWLVTQGPKVWDLSPTALLLSESGCAISTVRGDRWNMNENSLVAANPTLHRELLHIFNS